jgi:aminoglycoside 3-N-acetyltransferase I
MQVTIQQLSAADLPLFLEVIHVFKRVFESEPEGLPTETHLRRLLENENFMVFVALHEGVVVGGLTVDVLPQYHRSGAWAYIRDLAVEVAYQRKGIGHQLVQAVRKMAYNQDFEDVFVQTEEDDEQAINFYRKTKPDDEMRVLHFTYDAKKFGAEAGQ